MKKRIVFYKNGFINLTKPNMQCIALDIDKDWWFTAVEVDVFNTFMVLNQLNINNFNELVTRDGTAWGIVR